MISSYVLWVGVRGEAATLGYSPKKWGRIDSKPSQVHAAPKKYPEPELSGGKNKIPSFGVIWRSDRPPCVRSKPGTYSATSCVLFASDLAFDGRAKSTHEKPTGYIIHQPMARERTTNARKRVLRLHYECTALLGFARFYFFRDHSFVVFQPRQNMGMDS